MRSAQEEHTTPVIRVPSFTSRPRLGDATHPATHPVQSSPVPNAWTSVSSVELSPPRSDVMELNEMLVPVEFWIVVSASETQNSPLLGVSFVTAFDLCRG